MQTTLALRLRIDSKVSLENLKKKCRDSFGEELIGLEWFEEGLLPTTTKASGKLLPGKTLDTLAQTLEKYKIELPVNYTKWKTHWRALDPAPIGEVEGLATLRGKVIATDGVKSIMIRSDGKWFFIHNLSFLKDEESVELEYKGKVKSVKQTALEKALELYE